MKIEMNSKNDPSLIFAQHEDILGDFYLIYQKMNYQVVAFNPDKIYMFGKGFESLKQYKRSEDFKHYQSKDISFENNDPMQYLKSELVSYQDKQKTPMDTPFFKGGYAGAITFEGLSKMLEIDMSRAKQDPIAIGWFDSYIVKDLDSDDIYIVLPDENSEFGYYLENLILSGDMLETYANTDEVTPIHPKKSFEDFRNLIQADTDNKDKYLSQVENIKASLKKGESFQTVLSHQVNISNEQSPFETFLDLRKHNSTYKFLFRFFDTSIAGISPENLFVLEDGVVSMVPLAGTRSLSNDEEKNKENEIQLTSCNKENAEHTMLVDLVRSDLGRVCAPGSVAVERYKYTDRYREVMHLASDIKGSLDKGKDVFDLLKAVSPAGTMSGAPKVRSIEIIENMEKNERGFYSGNIGLINVDGSSDFSIIIRSIIFKEGIAQLQAGAGIVLDSIAENEFEECIFKMYSCGKEIQ